MSYKVAVVLTERLDGAYDLRGCRCDGTIPYTGMLGILEQDRFQVRNAMELVNAWELKDRDFTQVSDGQRQRVLLRERFAKSRRSSYSMNPPLSGCSI